MDAMDGRSDDQAEEVVDVIAQLMPVVTQIDPDALDAALDVLVERARANGRAVGRSADRADGDGRTSLDEDGDSRAGPRGDEPRSSPHRGTVAPG